MVEQPADAGGVYLFGDGVGYCGGDAAVYGAHETAGLRGQRGVRGRDRDVSVLHLHRGFQSGDAGSDPSYL